MRKKQAPGGRAKKDNLLNRELSGRLTTFLLILLFLAGLSLMLFPTVSDVSNSYQASRDITDYAESVQSIPDEDYSAYIRAAQDYNRRMAEAGTQYHLADAERVEYNRLLDITGTGIMGYISIPAIDVSLPIYHGTEESILSKAVGHLDWTSLPVGGGTSHCVLSGHRGLPTARLFTNLDKLAEGDTFMLQILNETFTYQVDQILVVLPEESEELALIDGQDCCTLVTCTPYGINTHRLLVRGRRIENAPDTPSVIILSDARLLQPFWVALMIGVPMYLLFLAFYFVFRKKPDEGQD